MSSLELVSASARLAATLNLEEIENEIQILSTEYTSKELSQEKPFNLSSGANYALCLLTTLEDKDFHVGVTPRKEVIWCFRIFLQFTGKTLSDNDNEAWEIISEYISDTRNMKKYLKTMDAVLREHISSFNFSNENIDKVELLVSGLSLVPQQFVEICHVSRLLMFALREAAVYSAIIKGKVLPSRKFSRLLHKRALLTG